MKISDMPNDQAADALIRLSVPFGNICNDEEALKMIEEYKSMSDLPLISSIGKLLPNLAAYMFKTHKFDLYEIVGALTQKKAEAVAKMNFFETIKILKDSYDEVFQGFFTSSVMQMKKSAGKS